MILEVFGLILFFIVIIILSFDLFPQIKDWSSRISIGRHENINTWNKAINNRGSKWLLKTPKIKVTDNTRLVFIDILKGNYSKSAIQHWQEASLLLGISEYLKYNNDPKTKDEIQKYLNTKFDQTGQWIRKPKYIDGAILAYAVMKLDFIETDKYKKAFDYVCELIKEHLGEDGTVMYRKFMKDYRYVDTIGFISPFLVTYGVRYSNEECVKLSIKQIKEYEKYGMHNEHFIPSHAYSVEGKLPLGLYGWGRGLGWFAIGLIDTWNELQTIPMHKYNLELDECVKKFAKAIIKFQQANGGWNWTVSRSECRSDSSATATLCWFLLNAAKIDGISKECFNSVENAFSYLMKVTKRDGAVDFSQGDTKDIGVYSMEFGILPFTQGFSIRSINYYSNFSKEKNIRHVG
jgi:unsaturated rhamnogalacturonyl hydrolase